MRRAIPCLLALTAATWADGGKVLFQRKAGSLNITLFTAPNPVRVGKADLSVMVQNTSDQSPVLDATVRVRLIRREPNAISEISAPARHEQATNKLLYAALLDLTTSGKYRAEVSVQTRRDSALVTGELDVLPPEPAVLAHWPYFMLLPVVALLFAFNQRLKRRRRAANPQ